MDWVGKSELLHRAPRLYTQVYSPGGNLKQNKHWRVTLEPRIARYRGTLLLPNMRGAHSRTRLDNNRHDRPADVDGTRLFSCGALTRTAKVYGFSVVSI